VLLLVLDGASLAVFHEIAADLARFGWIELGPSADGEVGERRFGLAVLPTVTEVSRTSLLTGKVCKLVARQRERGWVRAAMPRCGTVLPSCCCTRTRCRGTVWSSIRDRGEA
jgi:hypothetical protein